MMARQEAPGVALERTLEVDEGLREQAPLLEDHRSLNQQARLIREPPEPLLEEHGGQGFGPRVAAESIDGAYTSIDLDFSNGALLCGILRSMS